MSAVFDFEDINRRMNRKPEVVAKSVGASCSHMANVTAPALPTLTFDGKAYLEYMAGQNGALFKPAKVINWSAIQPSDFTVANLRAKLDRE